MNNRFVLIVPVLVVCSFSLIPAAGAAVEKPALAWESSTGFAQPESVVYDSDRNQLYVSNMQGGFLEKDGNGYLSKVDMTGKVITEKWIEGLNAPKGLAIVAARLYITDIDELVEVDLEYDKIEKRFPAPGAKFLNDIAIDANGNVYVSDTLDNKIYRLKDGELKVWAEGSELNSPNGLFAEADRLVVGTWGDPEADFSTKVPGTMKAVSLEGAKVSKLGKGSPIGNLDGVEADGTGKYWVTDWSAGKLFKIDAKGVVQEILSLGQGSADLEFVAEQGLLIIPVMSQSKLVAYSTIKES